MPTGGDQAAEAWLCCAGRTHKTSKVNRTRDSATAANSCPRAPRRVPIAIQPAMSVCGSKRPKIRFLLNDSSDAIISIPDQAYQAARTDAALIEFQADCSARNDGFQLPTCYHAAENKSWGLPI
jgi:hypothetical protein